MIDSTTPLIEFPWRPDLDMRQIMVANALSTVGLHGGTPETVEAFQRLLGPSTDGRYGIWPLDKPYGRGGMSTCAMVALGLLRRAGVACPDIRDGYHDDMGSGLRVAIDFARGLMPRPAWIRFIPGLLPQPGDVVQLLAPMHALTVVGWEEKGGVLQCVSVDGGQVGADGLQAIHVCRRPWVETDTGAELGGREVDGWIDVGLLPYSGPVMVPVGWESVEV